MRNRDPEKKERQYIMKTERSDSKGFFNVLQKATPKAGYTKLTIKHTEYSLALTLRSREHQQKWEDQPWSEYSPPSWKKNEWIGWSLLGVYWDVNLATVFAGETSLRCQQRQSG